jgi:hypothetical protein
VIVALFTAFFGMLLTHAMNHVEPRQIAGVIDPLLLAICFLASHGGPAIDDAAIRRGRISQATTWITSWDEKVNPLSLFVGADRSRRITPSSSALF